MLMPKLSFRFLRCNTHSPHVEAAYEKNKANFDAVPKTSKQVRIMLRTKVHCLCTCAADDGEMGRFVLLAAALRDTLRFFSSALKDT